MKSPHGNEPFDLILKQVKMKGAFSISPAFSAETVHSLREQPPSSWLSPSLGGSRAGSAGPGLQAPFNICAGGRPGGGLSPASVFLSPPFSAFIHCSLCGASSLYWESLPMRLPRPSVFWGCAPPTAPSLLVTPASSKAGLVFAMSSGAALCRVSRRLVIRLPCFILYINNGGG